jgi:sulfur-oxidizing protein SoxY
VPVWPGLRDSYFGRRAIDDNSGTVITLDAPARAEDASTVPIAIHSKLAANNPRRITRLWLFVDKNPSPAAAAFQFTPDSGRADIETRIRIEEYTEVRAVAELDNGELYMASQFVKAAGGCSAPAGKDLQAALAHVGRMKLKVAEPVSLNQPAQASVAVSHPNASGLVLDQVTRLYQPAYFVRKLTVSYAGRTVLTADIDFSISENPNFRFWFLPRGDGELKAEVVDTKDLSFQSEIAVKPARDGGGS